MNEREETNAPWGAAADSTGDASWSSVLKQALARERLFFETLFNSLPGPAFVFRKDGRFVRWNRYYQKVLGYTPEQLANVASFVQTVDSCDREKAARAVETVFCTGYYATDLLVLTADGRSIPHYCVGARMDLDGTPYLAGAGFDITERKQTEAALARDEAELSAVYDNAPIVMLLLDREQKIRRANRAALVIAGKAPTEAVGLRACNLFRCSDEPRGCGTGPACANCQFKLALTDTFENGTTHHPTEALARLVRGDRTVDTWVSFSTARVLVAGEPMVLLSVADISQKKLAEQRLRQQATLLDITSDAIMVVDPAGRVSYWNRGAERIYGWPVDEVLQQPLEALTSSEPQPDLHDAIKIIRGSGQWNGEIVQRVRNGSLITVACRGVLMPDPSDAARDILLTASDITEAKKLESQFLRMQRLDTLGALASGVAHDLNNVFTPITLSLEILRDGTDRDPAEKDMIDLLDESVRRGVDIVRQLLVFGRGSESPLGTVSVAHVINELRRMLRPTLPKDIDLSIQLPTDLWTVHGDPTQLHQLLLNLCVNARDAMSNGGRLAVAAENVRVEDAFARAHLGANPGPHVRISVTDTGMGIPPENLSRIFEPFFTTKPVGKGTGLGLATVFSIARAYGGFVCVRSEIGTGSEFEVYLPAQGCAERTDADSSRKPTTLGRGELILVVDDEAPIRQTLQSVLQKHGYCVITAPDGPVAEALFAARATEVRLVITDSMMPGWDGIKVVGSLRRINPKLPILVISAAPSHRRGIEQLPAPQVRFIGKPFTPAEILSAVRQALDDTHSGGPTENHQLP